MSLNIFKTLNENFSIKLFTLFALFVFIIFFSFTAVFIHLEGKSLNDSLIRDGSLLAGVLAQNTRIGVFSENEELLKDPVESIFQREDILGIWIYNQDGLLLKKKIREGKAVSAKLDRDETTGVKDIFDCLKKSGKPLNYEDHGNLKFWAQVFSRYDNSLNGTIFTEEPLFKGKDRLIGYVQITLGKEKLNEQLNNLFIRSVIIAVIFFIAGFIFLYSAMKRFTKPLNRLTVAVKNVGEGKVVGEISVETKDEIGKLANAFNNMVESIRWREQAIKESEAKYRTLFEESRDVIFLIDARGKFMDANQAAVDLFGYTKDEILEEGLDVLFVQPDEFSNLKRSVDHDNYARDMEVRLKRKDAKQLICLLTLSVRRAEKGDIWGYQGIIRDVTHQKMLETQLMQAQRMESIGTLAGGIAHDFNNILSPIMLHTEMVMDDLPSDDPLLFNMKEILKAAERARELVKQILTFARKGEEEKIVIKSSMIIKEAINFLRATIPSTIKIKYEVKTEKDIVLADPTRINQIVMNLCTNAAHAMKEKGGLLEVILDHEEISNEIPKRFINLIPGKYMKLTVRDTGTGILPEVIDRIFEPYFTTKKFGEGTGLGLATVHGVVKDYGGDITVESKVGSGTEFHVYLPSVDAEMPGTGNEIDPDTLRGAEHILFVDDEISAVDISGRMLERYGYKVTGMTDSQKALEVFQQNPEEFDLIITDMTMPNLAGDALSVKVMAIRPEIPVILCTGYSDKINEEIAHKIGVRAFVMKPVIMKNLAETIRDVLDNKI
ncbi:MAG: PAS domain S-box protein [Deltaproteobacteria bacterium]|nr:PAS domain S-box protein [Deltaproteobacteria bacterium]